MKRSVISWMILFGASTVVAAGCGNTVETHADEDAVTAKARSGHVKATKRHGGSGRPGDSGW